MKTFWKIVSALAAVAGVVFVIAAYGDKIVAWAKKVFPCFGDHEVIFADDFSADDFQAEDGPADEKKAEEPAAEEAPAEDEPVAEDNDFEG